MDSRRGTFLVPNTQGDSPGALPVLTSSITHLRATRTNVRPQNTSPPPPRSRSHSKSTRSPRNISADSNDTVIHRPFSPILRHRSTGSGRRPPTLRSYTANLSDLKIELHDDDDVSDMLPLAQQQSKYNTAKSSLPKMPSGAKNTPSSTAGTKTPTTTTTLEQAFFKTHWTTISRLAYMNEWYPTSCFLGGGSASHTQVLLDESKLPLLASCVRDVYHVYGPDNAWELSPHVYFGEGGKGAKIAWSHARRGELMKDREGWRGVLERGERLGFEAGDVALNVDAGRLGGTAGLWEGDDSSAWLAEMEGGKEGGKEDLPVGSSDEEAGEETSDEGEKSEDEGREVWKTPYERRVVGMAL